jgi:hypothetical protein
VKECPSHSYMYTLIQEKKELGRTIFELGQLSSPTFRMIPRSSYLNKRYYQVYDVTEEPTKIEQINEATLMNCQK